MLSTAVWSSKNWSGGWEFKNENAGVVRRKLSISSGFPRFWIFEWIMQLTEIRHGAGGLFAADDFDGLCGCRWGAHHGITRRHSVPIFIHLPAILNHPKLLDRLHHVVRLWWWCRRDVRLLIEVRRVHDVVMMVLMIIQVVEDIQMVVVVNLWRLVEHLWRVAELSTGVLNWQSFAQISVTFFNFSTICFV